jgi:hypothetical protein
MAVLGTVKDWCSGIFSQAYLEEFAFVPGIFTIWNQHQLFYNEWFVDKVDHPPKYNAVKLPASRLPQAPSYTADLALYITLDAIRSRHARSNA